MKPAHRKMVPYAVATLATTVSSLMSATGYCQVCTEKGHYDQIDLEAIPDDYLPRTNYHPMADRTEYLRRTPRVSWVEPGEAMAKPVTGYFRYVHRRAISTSMERSLIVTVIPPGAAHVHTMLSMAFRSPQALGMFVAFH